MMHEGMQGGGFWLMLIMGVIMVIPFWRICRRLGFPGFMGLLVLVPLLNLVFFYYLAFASWPIDEAGGPDRDSN